jgi:GTP-binding protein HflX
MIVFNKIEAYRWTPQDEDDLTEPTRENVSLEELKHTWMAKISEKGKARGEEFATAPLFISAREKNNIDELRALLYSKVRELHVQKYPYNDFLYPIED